MTKVHFKAPFVWQKYAGLLETHNGEFFRDFDLVVDLFVCYLCNIFWIFYLLLDSAQLNFCLEIMSLKKFIYVPQ